MKLYICTRPGYSKRSWVGALIVAADHPDDARYFCLHHPSRSYDQFCPETVEEIVIPQRSDDIRAALIYDDYER